MNKAILIALLTGASTLAAPAYGQESAENGASAEEQAIVVTGLRASLQNNVQLKRNAKEIVDSITATDIGKLPDSNVAETLTRVPGVQAYRFGGEAASPFGIGSGVTVRGLTGQTASRTNGRAYFTAGQREFNIEGTSPAMVAGVDVYKNPSAEHIEGGIGGVVNVRTRRPLEFKGFTATVSAGAKYNDLAEKAKPEFFGLLSNRWDVGDGGELGVMIAGSYLQTINRGDNTPAPGGVSFRRAVNGASAEYAAGAASGLYNSTYIGRSDVDYLATVNPLTYTGDRSQLISVLGETPSTSYEQYIRTRKGVNGMIQYKPNDDLEFYAEGLYNWYRYHQEFGFLGTNNSRYVQDLDTRPFDVTEGFANRNINGGADEVLAGQLLTGGTFLGSGANVLSGLVKNTYWTAVAAGGFKWHAADHLQADFDFSYVKSRVENNGRALSFASAQGKTWDISRDFSGEPARYTFAGPDLSQASSWVYRGYNAGPTIFEDNGIAARLDLTRSFDESFLESIKFGVRYATQNDTFRNFTFGGINLTTNGLPLAADYSNAISVGSLGVTGLAPSNFMDGQAGYTGGFLIYSPPMLAGDRIADLFPQSGIPDEGTEAEQPNSRRRFEEKTYAAYLSADFANSDRTIRGNAGVRIVKTDTFTRALIPTATGGSVPNEGNNSYTDVLPSLNITWYARPETLVRLGYGKGITRPDPGSLNPSLVVNQGTGTASIGNPDLKPQKGDSYDLSVEHYFSGANYVSAGIFYKRVKGFFSSISSCQTLPGFTYTGLILNGCPTGQYGVSQTVNAETSTVKGLEVAAQSFFDYDFVPDFLQKFGASASFTYLDTEIPVRLSSGLVINTRQPFTSKYNYTLAGFYEDEGISARLVYTWRSRSILFGAANTPAEGRYIQAFGVLDASVNFDLPHDLQLSLTASNLTNTAPNRFFGEPGYYTGVERQHFMNGRVFGAALRWRFGS